MSLEDPLTAPTTAPCIEPGCDRVATDGDERCELHQVRLGARPSGPSAPRPAPTHVVVEAALDASVAVPPPARVAARSRNFWLGLGGWALGSAAFFGCPIAASGLHLEGLPRLAFIVLWLASGALASFGAGKSIFAATSRAGSAVCTILAVATGIPTLLALAFMLFAVYRS